MARDIEIVPQSLKEATRATCAAIGGLKCAAAIIGLTKARISNCQNDYNDDKQDDFLNVRHAVTLDLVSIGRGGDPYILQRMAREVGGIFSFLPRGLKREDHFEQIAQNVSTHAKLLNEWIPSVADLKITPAEAKKIRPLVHKMVQELVDLEVSLPEESND